MTLKTSFLTLLFLLLLGGCRTVRYVPVKEYVQVAVHDTTTLRVTDTLVRVPEVRLADLVDLNDTLVIRSPLAVSRSWMDTTFNALRGELVQEGSLPVTIVERERVVYRDSIRDREVPVPVEVPTPYTPWYSKALSAVGILALLLLAGWTLLKTVKK